MNAHFFDMVLINTCILSLLPMVAHPQCWTKEAIKYDLILW